jgi:hypothetical protein
MDKSLAAHYYKLSADQGNAAAQCHYWFLLYTGDGIAMDKSLAVRNEMTVRLVAKQSTIGRFPRNGSFEHVILIRATEMKCADP